MGDEGHSPAYRRLMKPVLKDNGLLRKVLEAAEAVIENDQHISFGIEPPGWRETHMALHQAVRQYHSVASMPDPEEEVQRLRRALHQIASIDYSAHPADDILAAVEIAMKALDE